jgi:ABC-type lipoprotein release transport system permease subunit
MEILIIAWRNIWRNKKRTLITAGSVFFALMLSLIMVGLQNGTYEHMIKTSVEDFYGYIQVHQKGYQKDPTLTNSLEYNEAISKYLLSNNNVADLHPRIETFSLSAFEDRTKGIVIIGVDPKLEFEKPGLKKRLVEGDFPNSETGGLLITEKYAKYIGAKIGDSIALIGQGYQGVSAVGLYKVVGIIKLPNPQLNSGLAYMELKQAQELFSLQGRLTSVVVRLKDNSEFRKTTEELAASLPTSYEILNWEQEMPELLQMIESDSKSGKIMLMILYIVIGFGIFGTALMMTAERIKEFGIMIAVGMQKSKIIILVACEMIFIALVGIVASIVSSLPIIYYLHLNPITITGELATTYEAYGFEPIMPVAWQLSYYVAEPLIVLIITFLAIIYPLYGIKNIQVVKALKK